MPDELVYGNPSGESLAVDTVRAIYEAFARRDTDAALPHLSEDCVFYPVGTARRMGRESPYIGHAGVRAYFEDATRVWDDLTLHAEDIRAAGEGVVVFGWIDGTTADGTHERRSVVWYWRVKDGKAESMRVTDIGEPRGPSEDGRLPASKKPRLDWTL